VLQPEALVLPHGLEPTSEVDSLRPDRRIEQLGERRRHRSPLFERAQDILAGSRVQLLEARDDFGA